MKLQFIFLPIPEELMRSKALSWGAKYLFGIYAKANKEDIRWSATYLAERMGCEVREVRRRKAELIANNFIIVKPRRGRVDSVDINFELVHIVQEKTPDGTDRGDQVEQGGGGENGQGNSKEPSLKNSSNMSDEPTAFNLEDEIKKLKTDQRRHIQIVGLWFEIKNLNPGNKEQFDSIKKRSMRPAALLKGYSDQDIKDTLEHTKTLNYLTNVGLETILKYIDEVIKSKNKREPEKKEIRINGRLVVGRKEVRKFDDDNRPYLTTVPIFEDEKS